MCAWRHRRKASCPSRFGPTASRRSSADRRDRDMTAARPLTFALLGAGFWARYQLAAWSEHPGVHCIAICDPDRDKAAYLAERYQVTDVYTSLEEMLAKQRPDFVDIVTPPGTH